MDRYAPSPRPSVCLAVDFGAGFLITGISGPDGNGYRTLEFPGWSQEMPAAGTGGPVHAIPVLVHYDEDRTRTIGSDVIRAGHTGHPATARWIRTYLLENSPVRLQAGEQRITFRDAAVDFLGTVLARAVRECPGNPSVVFAIPAGAPEWYAGWLGTVARGAGVMSWHTVDEHAAAAAGYGLVAGEGQEFVVVRFDETDLTVSVITSEAIPDHSLPGPMRVAGTACEDTGCRALDGWIAQEMLARNRPKYSGAKAERMYHRILGMIGEVHGQLAAAGEAMLEIADPPSGATVSGRVSRDDIGRIVAEHGFPSVLERAVGRAQAAARSYGGGEAPPVAVLMTGRGSAIPAVQELVKERFYGVPVLCDHPFDAVARGAALFRPGAARPDRIRNDYALRVLGPGSPRAPVPLPRAQWGTVPERRPGGTYHHQRRVRWPGPPRYSPVRDQHLTGCKCTCT